MKQNSSLRGGNDDEDESEYAASRYKAPIKEILNDLVANSLDLEEYPSLIPMPASMSSSAGKSARSARKDKAATKSARKNKGASDKWASTGSAASTTKAAISFTGARSIVYMMGGLSYSELRVAEKIMEKESKDIIMGSTSLISPNEFLDSLATLD